jgi:oligogalacturonide lyase
LSVAVDGLHAAFVEAREEVYRLRLVALAKAEASTVVETRSVIGAPAIRPRRAGILYRRSDQELWLVNYDGAQHRRLKTAPGRLGPAQWSSDGRSVFYLRTPDTPRALTELREHIPDANTDQLIAPTSQFVSFASNRDGSVFAGASGSKASPYLLVLLRATRRELTLCEHRSTKPETVTPVFSTNSQRLYFNSDRHGKPAIYMMRVDRFIEKTET